MTARSRPPAISRSTGPTQASIGPHESWHRPLQGTLGRLAYKALIAALAALSFLLLAPNSHPHVQ